MKGADRHFGRAVSSVEGMLGGGWVGDFPVTLPFPNTMHYQVWVLAFLVVCNGIALWLSPPFLKNLSVLEGHVDILFCEIYPSLLLIINLLFLKKNVIWMNWEDSSVGKVVATQMRGPECRFPEPT